MLRFHRKTPSLIPVRDMEKMEHKQHAQVEAVEEPDIYTARQRRNLVMIYLVFLAEAIMAASLASQINILLPSGTGSSGTGCLNMDTSFLRSVLRCAYYFGSAAGLLWGLAADRLGRRRVAVVALMGMSVCCFSMGFATTFAASCILRCFAGAISSAATVSGLAMLADFTHDSNGRTKIVSRLPVLAVCGQLGPLVASLIRKLAKDHLGGIFVEDPNLAGQMACGFLVLGICLSEFILLDETLLGAQQDECDEDHIDCEKAAFLGRSFSNSSDDSLNISIIEALNDDAAAPRPSRITIAQMITAPSVLILLTSFSVLSLHASTFEILMPHIGHDSTHNFGLGISCSWLGPMMLIVQAVAALRIMHFVPFVVRKMGLLPMYRRTSLVFPALYIMIPLVSFGVSATGASHVITAVVSTAATLVKSTLAGTAHVLVLLLVFSAAPDASSTGTLIGVISVSELFKAFAVGLTGISYYLSDDYSVVVVNGALWAALASVALVGAAMTWKLRETPRVGADIPEECLSWQGMFDAESDDDSGF